MLGVKLRVSDGIWGGNLKHANEWLNRTAPCEQRDACHFKYLSASPSVNELWLLIAYLTLQGCVGSHGDAHGDACDLLLGALRCYTPEKDVRGDHHADKWLSGSNNLIQDQQGSKISLRF